MIVVVGSVNLDLVATVARLPKPGETVAGETFATAPGGKGANQALAARRAGADVVLVGAVGRDAFAGEALALLDAGGVDLSKVRRAKAATGTALILVEQGGENAIAVVAGANGTVTAADVAAAGISAGDHVLLQQEVSPEAVEAALQAARAAGALSILNTAPFRAGTERLAALADVVVANAGEFERLAATPAGTGGGDREALMRAFAGRTGRDLVVTLGDRGVAAARADGTFLTVPGLPVAPVDTVGAGDTFCGYLAAGLAAGRPFEEALRRAAAAGSLACLKAGAQASIPLAAEVDAALVAG